MYDVVVDIVKPLKGSFRCRPIYIKYFVKVQIHEASGSACKLTVRLSQKLFNLLDGT